MLYLQYVADKIKNFIHNSKANYYEKDVALIKQILEEKQVNQEVLQDVSLTIKPGQITALVGRNGAGKTTITHLLQHHFEPDQGRVLLDEQEIYQYNPQQLIKQFSWLQQQPFILDRFSFIDNLLLGVDKNRPDLREDLHKILTKLDLDQLIANLPKKEATIIGVETHLSGGQEQLLAIARALLQKRPFLILDEGSSQLDAEKEFQVLQLLQEEKQRCAVLFITHRMSVARKADQNNVTSQQAARYLPFEKSFKQF